MLADALREATQGLQDLARAARAVKGPAAVTVRIQVEAVPSDRALAGGITGRRLPETERALKKVLR